MIHYRWLLPRVAALLAVMLFAQLGFWQLHRAEEARVLEESIAGHFQARPQVIDGAALESDLGDFRWRPVATRGRWDASRQILLDNQVSQGEAGYFVYTPLRFERCDCAVLVNRGWIPAGAHREIVPDLRFAPAADSAIRGIAAPAPASGFGMQAGPGERLGVGVLRVQRLDAPELSQWVGRRIVPLTILLDAGEPHGYRREWRPPDPRADRHIAYAGQWFLFAVIAAGVAAIKLNSGRI